MVDAAIYISFIGAALLWLVNPGDKGTSRTIALMTAVAGFVFALIGVLEVPVDGNLATVVNTPWVHSLGIHYFIALDGISATLVILTGIAAIAGIFFSWNIEHRINEFFAFYLALIGGVYGVFMSFDLFLLFVFYEIAIVPKYFLIAIWGSGKKEYAAMKLVLYSFIGSALVLIGLLATYIVSGAHSTSLVDLAQANYPQTFQIWVFPLVFVGFAVLAGLWPFHTWAPTGHAAAPTAASMLLAGVVMKLGAYGALRVAITLFPEGLIAWRDVIAGLAVVGILYGGGVALVQKDFKFVIGYSSVSHMGFVILGLATLNEVGLSGAVLQMFSHGIIAGLLFAVVGRMVYTRTHTRNLALLEGMNLTKALPFAAGTFVVAGFASMGLPGFSGFVAELQVIVGAWQSAPWLAILAGLGIVIGAGYILRAMNQVFFSEPRPGDELTVPPAEPMSLPEMIGAVILIGATLAVGLYPRMLLDLIVPSLHSPLFDAFWKGVGA